MAALVGNLTSVGDPCFSLFFARQPEPDLEFTEEELEQTTATRPLSPMRPPKKSGGRPLVWLLLLALIGGAGYIAMEPEQLTEWLAPFLGETSKPSPAPPVAMKPRPAVPAPPAPPQPEPIASEVAPAPPAAPSAAPVAPPVSAEPAAPPVATAPAPPAPAPTPPVTATPMRIAPSPMFAEGQKVTVIGDPAVPNQTIALTLDPAGGKPGPSVRPGATLSILDGDLQPSGWVYSVRADDGVRGWVPEKRLRMKF
jgi:hypothetical protein